MNAPPGPRTTREALLAELLGDLGEVHDSIKELPQAVEDAMRPSLEALRQATTQAQALIESMQTLSDAIAEKLARESGQVNKEAKELLDRLEAIEARRTANGVATARQLVELMAEQTREIVRKGGGNV